MSVHAMYELVDAGVIARVAAELGEELPALHAVTGPASSSRTAAVVRRLRLAILVRMRRGRRHAMWSTATAAERAAALEVST